MTREEKLQLLARQRQLIAIKQQPAQSQSVATTPREEPSALEKFGHGLALSGVETGLGVKGLFTDLTPENQEVLKMMRQDAEDMGGWATGGRAVGEIAQLAVPAAKISKLSKLPAATKAAKNALIGGAVAGEIALGAGQGALKAPSESKTRTDEAIESGIGTALGMGAAKLLKPLADGFKQTDAAKYLGSLGVKLTPGQAAESGLIRAHEYLMSYSPVLARSVAKQKDMAEKTFNKAMLNRAAPTGTTVNQGGQAGMQELKDLTKQAYSDAWGKAKQLDSQTLDDLINKTIDAEKLGTEAALPMKKIQDAINNYSQNPTNKQLDMLDDKLRSELKRLDNSRYPNYELKTAIKDIRGSLRDGAGDEAKKALGEINKKYGKFKVLEKATGSQSAMRKGEDLDGGYFGGKELESAVKSIGGAGRTAYGKAPLQREAKAAAETLARKEPVPLLTGLRGVMKNIEIPLGVSGGIVDPVAQFLADAAMGRAPGQGIARALRNISPTGGAIGAGIEE